MKLIFRPLIACAALAILAAGCENRTSSSASVIAVSATGMISASVTDKWLGKWRRPEATFLQLDGGNGKCEVTIRNLDGSFTFHG
ncbi:MAG: hypothetical protein ACKVIS_21070, partial [Pseudomonadales bacterium]